MLASIALGNGVCFFPEEGGLEKLKHLIPRPLRRWLNRSSKAVGKSLLIFDRVTDWSVLRRLRPYRPDFGGRRGRYIDRFYIEQFLSTYRELVRGRVAELESDEYTSALATDRVEHSDILDINENNEKRTITIDLAETAFVPESVFDCILCTQTLFLIRDYASAVRSLYKMLKPGGVLLVTVPGISPIVRGHLLAGSGEDWWRFTGRSAQRIFGDVFGDEHTVVHTYGNVLTATAFLHGLVQEELTKAELEFNDPDYEVIIGVKATKKIAE